MGVSRYRSLLWVKTLACISLAGVTAPANKYRLPVMSCCRADWTKANCFCCLEFANNCFCSVGRCACDCIGSLCNVLSHLDGMNFKTALELHRQARRGRYFPFLLPLDLGEKHQPVPFLPAVLLSTHSKKRKKKKRKSTPDGLENMSAFEKEMENTLAAL